MDASAARALPAAPVAFAPDAAAAQAPRWTPSSSLAGPGPVRAAYFACAPAPTDIFFSGLGWAPPLPAAGGPAASATPPPAVPPAAPYAEDSAALPAESDKVSRLSSLEQGEVCRILGRGPEALSDVSHLALEAVRRSAGAPPCTARIRVRLRGVSFSSARQIGEWFAPSAPSTPLRPAFPPRSPSSVPTAARRAHCALHTEDFVSARGRAAAAASRSLSALLAQAASRDADWLPDAAAAGVPGAKTASSRRLFPRPDARALDRARTGAEKRARAAEARSLEAEAQASFFRDLARKRRRAVERLTRREEALEEALEAARARAAMAVEDGDAALRRALAAAAQWRDAAALPELIAAAARRAAALRAERDTALGAASALWSLSDTAASTAAALGDAARRAQRRDTANAEQEAEALRTNQLCLVCQDAPRRVLMLPCGHLCTCTACSSHPTLQGACPVCRGAVERTHVAYFS